MGGSEGDAPEILVEVRTATQDDFEHLRFPIYHLHTYGLGPAVLTRNQLLLLIQKLIWISNQVDESVAIVTEDD